MCAVGALRLPETIVAVAAANAHWNSHIAYLFRWCTRTSAKERSVGVDDLHP